MPPLYNNSELFKRGSKRPTWAGNTEIETIYVSRRAVFSDQKGKSKSTTLFERPIKVKAVVVPVRTPGRATPNVEGMETTYYHFDKGHAYAFSLGAPHTTKIMFQQFEDSNRKKFNPIQTNVSELTWRSMEVYVKYIAVECFRRHGYIPEPKKDKVAVKPVSGGAPIIKVNDSDWITVDTPDIKEYSRPGGEFSSEPVRGKVIYEVNLSYDDSRDESLSTTMKVNITLKTRNKTINVLSKIYKNENSFDTGFKEADKGDDTMRLKRKWEKTMIKLDNSLGKSTTRSNRPFKKPKK